MADANDPVTPLPVAARRCPICGKPAAEDSDPFCSSRCADVDLNRWLSDRYAIPGEPATGGEQDTDDE